MDTPEKRICESMFATGRKLYICKTYKDACIIILSQLPPTPRTHSSIFNRKSTTLGKLPPRSQTRTCKSRKVRLESYKCPSHLGLPDLVWRLARDTGTQRQTVEQQALVCRLANSFSQTETDSRATSTPVNMNSFILIMVALVSMRCACSQASAVDVGVTKVSGVKDDGDSLTTAHYMGIRERIDHLDDKICNSEKQLTELNGRFPLLESKFESFRREFESKIENMELKFRLELVNQFGSFLTEIKGLGLGQNVESPRSNVDCQLGDSVAIERKLDNVTSKLLQVESEVLDLQNVSSRLDEKVYSLTQTSDVCVRAVLEDRSDNCTESVTGDLQGAPASAWITILRRMDGGVNFTRGWDDYKAGFGDLGAEFWLGLEDIHQLTAVRFCRLRVVLTDFSGEVRFAEYSQFYIRGEAENYRLHVTGYVTGSNAGDSLTYHNNMEFSTSDQDNDKKDVNCAFVYKGGWWFNRCHYANPTGLYLGADSTSSTGINWFKAHDDRRSFKRLEMSIRHI